MGYEIFIAFKEMTVDVRPCIRTGKSSLKLRSHGLSVTHMCFMRKQAHAFWRMSMRF